MLGALVTMAPRPIPEMFAIFAIVPSIGSEHPEPAAIGNAFFEDRDTLGLARRIEGLLGNAVCGSFLAQLAGGAGSGGEGLTQPGACGSDGGQVFVAVRHRLSLDVEELVMKMMILAMIMLC